MRDKRKTILVAGLETIRQKNRHQFQALGRHGYDFVVVTLDQTGESAAQLKGIDNVRLVITPHGFKGIRSLLTLLTVLLTTRLHAAEIYPYSHVALLMTVLIKLFRIPVIAIARGEELNYLRGAMTPAAGKAFKATYRLTDHVIYKEPYMTEFLDLAGCKNRFLLSNAVRVPKESRAQKTNGCTLLFLNSIKDVRTPIKPLKAFLNLCARHELTKDGPYKFQIVGFQGNKASDEGKRNEAEVRAVMEGMESAPVELLPWTSNSDNSIQNADVFILSASIVFLNFALLEAMAYGLVPLVSHTDDSAKVVDTGISGQIVNNTVSAWENALESVMFDHTLRTSMGAAAKDKVQAAFSLEAYGQEYAAIYKKVVR